MKLVFALLCMLPTVLLGNQVPQLVTTKVPTLLENSVSNSGKVPSNCQIQQAECTRAPHWVGSFSDNFAVSPFVPGRCLMRAKEISLWCANPRGVVTTATFTTVEGKQISSSYAALGTSCVIRNPVCRLYPAFAGEFGDSFAGSESSLHRCAQRAQEYSEFCGNNTGVATTSIFTAASGETTTHTFVDASTSCVLEQSYCPRFEASVGIFADTYMNSNLSAARCLSRPQELAEWCGSYSGMSHKAIFTNADGSTVESTYIVP